MRYLLIFAVLLAGAKAIQAQQGSVAKSQKDRVDLIEKLKPTVVSIFAPGGNNGGTGVVITEDGYALTNFHVVQPTGPTMKCGLADGYLYDGVVVGIDKVGDVALIKLLPRTPGQKFIPAILGDSDTVKEGEWSLAMGNPFLLATDFTPTVTFGLISGVHRYQYPAGILLEYTDCIQFDTSINPGNSGGPLFSMKGELIGINGRGSFDKRGRVNSGVGYAISINQIKNFMGHLRAGLDADHASLGALVQTETEKNGLGRMLISSILEDSDAYRRGLDIDDELISFVGRGMTSVNHYRNVLGLFPRGWRVPIEFKHEGKRKEVLVRLMGVQRKQLDEPPPEDPDNPKLPAPRPKLPIPKTPDGKPLMPAPAPKASGPGAKFYKAKKGFANYYFNTVERDRLFESFKKHGDFSKVNSAWSFEGDVRLLKNRTESPFTVQLLEEKEGKNSRPTVKLKIEDFSYELEPLHTTKDQARQPTQSGGLMPALFVWQRLLMLGAEGFGADTTHAGMEPFYPPTADGKTPGSLASLRVDCEVLTTAFGPYLVKWFFDQRDQKLRGFELRMEDNEDPCEVYLSDYREVNGRQLPHRLQVAYRDTMYGNFAIHRYQIGGAK